MEILYEIKEFNSTTGSILVRYYDSSNTHSLFYNIDLPIVNGSLPNESGIADYINFMKPTGQMERLIALKTVEIPTFLQTLIIIQPTTPSGPQGDPSDPSPTV
jgi:hypothetical protein